MPITGSNPLADLKKIIIEQKKVFLPPEADDPSLAELHELVTRYDQIISQVVIGAIQGLAVSVPFHEIQHLQAAISQQLAAPQIQANRKADFYRTYTARLEGMLNLAQQVLNLHQ